MDRNTHYGIRCVGCQAQPIKGIRYKCVICVNYDLCQGCEEGNVTSHDVRHPLLKIKIKGDFPQDPAVFFDVKRTDIVTKDIGGSIGDNGVVAFSPFASLPTNQIPKSTLSIPGFQDLRKQMVEENLRNYPKPDSAKIPTSALSVFGDGMNRDSKHDFKLNGSLKQSNFSMQMDTGDTKNFGISSSDSGFVFQSGNVNVKIKSLQLMDDEWGPIGNSSTFSLASPPASIASGTFVASDASEASDTLSMNTD